MKQVQQAAEAILQQLETVIFGKRPVLELVLNCLFAEGHLLLEDVPGTAKTLLAMVASLLFYLVDVRSAFLGGGPQLKWSASASRWPRCSSSATAAPRASPTSRAATPWR